MSENSTHIWVIEQGSYSDYSVVAAFSNEAAALQHASDLNSCSPYEPASVAKWEVFSEAPEHVMVYNYELSKSGANREWSYDSWSNLQPFNMTTHTYANGTILSRARTPEEAKKAAYDAAAEAAAQRAGLT